MATKPDDHGEALEKINAQLECSICLDTFKDPKLLQCFHVFCQLCLEPLVSRDGQSLRCPACRRSIPLGPNGVSGLQSDFHVQHLFEIRDTLQKAKETQCEKCKKSIATGFCRDCGKFVCDKCIEMHQEWEELATHILVGLDEIKTEASSLVSSKKPIARCPKHPNKSLKIYCESCSELICKDCTIRLHQGHNFDLITEVLPKHKEEIVSSMEPVRQQLKTVEKGLQGIATVEIELKRHSEATEADIHREIDQAHQALDQRRQELVEQLYQLTRQKLKTLATQKEEIETAQVQLSSCMAYVDGSMETSTNSEVLAMKAPILKQVKELTTSFNLPAMTPAEGADSIRFVVGEQLQQTCRTFGAVVGSVVCPENSYVSGVQNMVREGEPTEVELHLVTQDGEEYHNDHPADLTAELFQCQSKTTSKCMIICKKGKTRAITFQPVRRGKHTLAVKVSGRDIQGSPFPVAVLPSLQNLAKPNMVITGVNKPWGVTTNSKGDIIVTEHSGHCVSVFTAEGIKISSFGSNGSGQGQFNGPTGVAVDNDDNIYVVDNNNHRIQKFTAGGQFIASVGSNGDQPLQFKNPVGIGLNKKNKKLYICDQANHRVQILNTDLTFHASFGSQGSANAQFQNCLYAAFHSAGDVYITDWLNHRVQVFTPEGKFLREIKATPKGSVQHAFGIAIDSSDNVYVSEGDNHCVDISNSRGEFLTSFGSRGTEEGQFYGAFGLHIDRNDRVLVCDCNNSRIQAF